MNVTLSIGDINDLISLVEDKIKVKKAEGCDECAAHWQALLDKLLEEKLKQ